MSDTRNPELVNEPEIFTLEKLFAENDVNQPIQIERVNKTPNQERFVFSEKNVDQVVFELTEKIHLLRESDFDYVVRKNSSSELTWVKYHKSEQINPQLNPLHPREVEIQALRYLKGMMLIISNLKDKELAEKIFQKVCRAWSELSDINDSEGVQALIDTYASILEKAMDLKGKKAHKHARNQVFMAKDLAIMLEDHPHVSTVHVDKKLNGLGNEEPQLIPNIEESLQESNTLQIRHEHAQQIKISDGFYTNKFVEPSSNPQWLVYAQKRAGFENRGNNWISNFFIDNWDEIKRKKVTAPPSARWLPIPGNVQRLSHTIYQSEVNDGMTVFHKEAEYSFTRMGIITPIELSHAKEKVAQKQIATLILKEMIFAQIEEQFEKYRVIYGEELLANQLFFINYQTLLSPVNLESLAYKFGHKDNNEYFVKMIKEIFKTDSQILQEWRGELANKFHDVNFEFVHTNSAINKLASHKVFGPFVAFAQWNFDDNKIRRDKIAAVQLLVNKCESGNANALSCITDALTERTSVYGSQKKCQEVFEAIDSLSMSGASPILLNEVKVRIKSAFLLRLVIDKQGPFSLFRLKHYQRNIMQSALEYLSTGNQALSLVGCKSARDRTAVFQTVCNVMLTKPEAMYDWNILKAGLVAELLKGFMFRAMSYHTAIAKIKDVHKDISESFTDKLQTMIAKNLAFTKCFSLDKTVKSVVKTIASTQASHKAKYQVRKNIQPASTIAHHDPRDESLVTIASRPPILTEKIPFELNVKVVYHYEGIKKSLSSFLSNAFNSSFDVVTTKMVDNKQRFITSIEKGLNKLHGKPDIVKLAFDLVHDHVHGQMQVDGGIFDLDKFKLKIVGKDAHMAAAVMEVCQFLGIKYIYTNQREVNHLKYRAFTETYLNHLSKKIDPEKIKGDTPQKILIHYIKEDKEKNLHMKLKNNGLTY